MKYLWDTNIVIYFLQKQFTPSAEYFVDNILEQSAPSISVISEMELLCWDASDEEDLKVLQKFIDSVIVYPIDSAIKRKTVDVRRSHRTKMPDAIIAATAIVYGLTLVTRNTKDFTSIDGLQIVNPFSYE